MVSRVGSSGFDCHGRYVSIGGSGSHQKRVKDFGTSSLLPHSTTYHEALSMPISGTEGRFTFDCFSQVSAAYKPGELGKTIKALVEKIKRGSADLVTQNLCMLYFTLKESIKNGDGKEQEFINPYIIEDELKEYVERLNKYGAVIFAGINKHLERAKSLNGVNTHARAMLTVNHFIDSEISRALLFYRKHVPSAVDILIHEQCVMLAPAALLVLNVSYDRFFWEQTPTGQRKVILQVLRSLVDHRYLEKDTISSFFLKMDKIGL